MSDTKERLEQLKAVPPWDWSEEAGDWLREALQDDDEQTRLVAARLASAVVDDGLAGELLRVCREDPTAEVASAAAIALGPALEECYVEYDEGLADAMPDLPETAPLSREVYQRVVETLEGIYHDADCPTKVRRRALEAAVRAPRDWQVGAARAAHRSEDSDWRMTAVFCMGYLPGFEETILKAMTEDEHPGVRREALLAAGNQEIDAAGPEVLRVAGDRGAPTELRIAAVAALETIFPEGSQELLETLAEAEDEELAEAASATLEERVVFGSLYSDEEDLDEDLD
jgi:HEAT repeat protein